MLGGSYGYRHILLVYAEQWSHHGSGSGLGHRLWGGHHLERSIEYEKMQRERMNYYVEYALCQGVRPCCFTCPVLPRRLHTDPGNATWHFIRLLSAVVTEHTVHAID